MPWPGQSAEIYKRFCFHAFWRILLGTLLRRRHDRLYLHGPHPRKTMVLNHGLHPLRTMVLKIPALAPGYGKEHRSGCRGGFQDHGSEGVETMVSDHGFARVGTMQVQAIMPPLIPGRFF